MGEITISLDMFVGVLMMVLFGPLAWVVKGLISDQKALAKELAEHKEHVASHCIKKTDYNGDLREIKDMLHAIFDKLEKKADK